MNFHFHFLDYPRRSVSFVFETYESHFELEDTQRADASM